MVNCLLAPHDRCSTGKHRIILKVRGIEDCLYLLHGFFVSFRHICSQKQSKFRSPCYDRMFKGKEDPFCATSKNHSECQFIGWTNNNIKPAYKWLQQKPARIKPKRKKKKPSTWTYIVFVSLWPVCVLKTPLNIMASSNSIRQGYIFCQNSKSATRFIFPPLLCRWQLGLGAKEDI